MSKWQQVKLNDCCASISDGDHQAPPKSESGIPFVTISNIDCYNSLDFSNVMYVPQMYYDKLDNKRKAQKGDIIYSVVGSFGIPVLIKDNTPFVFQRHIAILKPNDTVDSRFLYYTMLSRDFYHKADAVAVGAAQRTISLTALRNLEISLPPIEIQRKIADVLSAYDDLIENNRKQIKLLEEAAQRLYKEWFIDLRFPGYESTPIIDGVPEGWRTGKAIDFFNISIGKTPPRSENQCFTDCNNGIPWVSISDMGISGTYIFSTAEGLTADSINKYNVKKIPIGTILLSFKLTLGRVSIVTTPCCTNEAIAHFYTDKKWMREYIYLYLKNFEYDTLGNTSSISKAVNSSIIKAMPFILPETNLISAFSELTSPIFKKIYDAQQCINAAQNARNNLLPKLMIGELEVK